MNQITFKQYRNIDIVIFCILTAVFEAIASLATNRWFVLQAMAISITLTMTCITMMRWNTFAVLPSFIGAFVYCVASGGAIQQYVIYCGGSLFCLLALPILKKIGKEKVRSDFLRRTAFATLTYIFVVIGRWVFSLIFEQSIKSFLPFLTTDILSLLFAVVVLALAKNIDGLIEDQKSYLLRLDKERQEEQDANLNDNF